MDIMSYYLMLRKDFVRKEALVSIMNELLKISNTFFMKMLLQRQLSEKNFNSKQGSNFILEGSQGSVF
jgi:hypothetical protein